MIALAILFVIAAFFIGLAAGMWYREKGRVPLGTLSLALENLPGGRPSLCIATALRGGDVLGWLGACEGVRLVNRGAPLVAAFPAKERPGINEALCALREAHGPLAVGGYYVAPAGGGREELTVQWSVSFEPEAGVYCAVFRLGPPAGECAPERAESHIGRPAKLARFGKAMGGRVEHRFD